MTLHDFASTAREPRVLVTGIGGPAGQAFVSSFAPGEVEWRVADADRLAPGWLLHPESLRALVPRGDADGFVNELIGICLAAGIDVVVPTVDAELAPLAAARTRFGDAGIHLLLARQHALTTALDKWALMRALSGHVRIPESALVDATFDAAALAYPVVAKPRRGSGSRGVVVARRQSDLAGLPRDGSYLVQEYLPGPEYSLDVLVRRDGSVAAVVPRERLRTDSGIATVSRTVVDRDLIDLGAGAAEAIGLTGIGNVQCRRDPAGEPAVIEINPRVPGTMGLTVTAGINMPQLALGEALGTPIPHGLTFRERLLVRTWQDHVIEPAVDAISALEVVA